MRTSAFSSATRKASAVASSSVAATARATATCASFVDPLYCFFAAFQASGADSLSAATTRFTSSATSVGKASDASASELDSRNTTRAPAPSSAARTVAASPPA